MYCRGSAAAARTPCAPRTARPPRSSTRCAAQESGPLCFVEPRALETAVAAMGRAAKAADRVPSQRERAAPAEIEQ
eukprot:7384946-Prymnesium_polylepis.2